MTTYPRGEDRGLRPPGPLVLGASILLVAVATLITFSWLIAVIAHLDDAYAVDHVAGTWMALAAYVNEGTLYPPLYDGDAFGGTRFMPLPMLLQALGADVTGEYLVSAKLLSAVLLFALGAYTFLLLRRRCSPSVAFALSATLLISGTGLVAATSIRNDTLPVLLQLVAISLVVAPRTRTTVIAAGLLCGLAVLGKLSALWAPIAIVIWLARCDRARLLAYVTTFGSVLVVGLVAVQLASEGRFDDNVLGLSATSSDRFGSLHDQIARLRLIAREGLGPLAWLPLLAVAGTYVAARRREIDIYHVAFVAAALVTAVVLIDPGAYVNHLLDVQVLSLFVVAEISHRMSRVTRSTASWASFGLVLALLAASAATFYDNTRVGSDLRVLVSGTDPKDGVPPLSAVIGPRDRVLSEDPFVPVSHGLRPIVLDPYMLLGLLEDHPAWRRDLTRRIQAAEFDKIVLLYRPEEAPVWYERVHLGSAMTQAIRERYRPAELINDRWVFVPK